MAANEDKSAKQLAYEKFENVFKDTLIEQILAHAKKYKLPEQYLTWFEKVSSTCRVVYVNLKPINLDSVWLMLAFASPMEPDLTLTGCACFWSGTQSDTIIVLESQHLGWKVQQRHVGTRLR